MLGCSAFAAQAATDLSPANPIVVGYFGQWGVYDHFFVKNLLISGAAAQLDQINYSQGSVTGARCNIADPNADLNLAFTAEDSVNGIADNKASPFRGDLHQLAELKKRYPQLKILISLEGKASDFAIAAQPENRSAFVASCIDRFIRGHFAPGAEDANLFDGIDLDWEFPNANDTANFTALLTEFRTEMNTLTGTTGRTYQLVADLAAGPSTPGAAADSGNDGGYDTINISAVAAELNWMNVDGYNYDGDWTNATNDASALYDETANPLYGTPADDIDATVQYYMAHGAPAAKYTMGFPLYGAGWAGGLTSANGGMYQNATGVTDGSGAMTTNGTSPVYNANGVGYCSTGENQGSPTAGCDLLLTDGLATYGTIEIGRASCRERV